MISRPKVYLPIISYDGRVHVGFMFGLIKTITKVNCESKISTSTSGGIAINRNLCADVFLRGDCEYIFFVDTDIVFDEHQFGAVLAKCVAGLPVVAGMYAKKKNGGNWVLNELSEADRPDPRSGLMSVKHAGTGFLCVHRRVFEAIRQRFPQLAFTYKSDTEKKQCEAFDFFPMGARCGEYESEDWAFCRMARECGFSIYVDTKVQLQHVGEAVYPAANTWTDSEIEDLVFARHGVRLSNVVAETRRA